MAGELIELMVVGAPITISSAEREEEFVECLRKNAGCAEIGRVLLVEEEAPIADARAAAAASQKIEVTKLGRRLSWDEAVAMACERVPSGVCCVANADVHFDETLAKLRKWTRWGDSMVALSRNCEPNTGSADAWIFKTPLALKAEVNFGQMFMQRRVCAVAQDARLLVVNPATSIMLRHLHSNHPGYNDATAWRGRAAFPHAYSTLVSLDLD